MGTSSLIATSGMIGTGKTTLSSIISERFEVDLYNEPIDSPILEQFYIATPEEQEEHRYSFLLQLDFLASRYETLQEASERDRVAVIDRSLHEDYHFAKVNTDIGNIRPIEFQAYKGVYDVMMKEIGNTINKTPIVMVYLTGSFETSIERIKKRGREFELGEDLIQYYYQLWKGYDDWVEEQYKYGVVYKIDVDEVDFLHNLDHQDKVLQDIQSLVNEQITDKSKHIHLKERKQLKKVI